MEVQSLLDGQLLAHLITLLVVSKYSNRDSNRTVKLFSLLQYRL